MGLRSLAMRYLHFAFPLPAAFSPVGRGCVSELFHEPTMTNHHGLPG